MLRKQPELKVVMVPIDELKPYENNAKKHTNEQMDAVEASIREFDFTNPVIAWHDEDGRPVIVAGHARAEAARRQGLDAVPVIFRDDWDDAKRRAYVLVDNQTTMMTGWDEDLLSYELDTLADVFDMEDFGFEVDGPEDISAVDEDDFDEDVEDRVKLGEVWRMGDHVLLCGDATKPENVAKLMESLERIGGGRLADLLLTDPPYNVALGQHYRPSELKQLHRRTDGLVIENDEWDSDEGFVQFLADALGAASSALRDGGSFYIWYASTQGANFLEGARRAGLQVRQLLVWAKNTFAMGRQDYQWRHELCLYGWKAGAAHYFFDSRSESTVLEAPRPNPAKMSKRELVELCKELQGPRVSTTVIECDKPSANEDHPTMKPVRLFAYQIRNSTERGGTVLDPFGGSGTSVIACEQIGRRCATMELDPHYASVIVSRWESLTGREAVRLD